ncbi:MAG: D-glycero-beta-D-manno-heptose 1-phosphate adenylyltransferase [Pseudomonadota bacterium]|nr:D-glycero-beta-D-manno-heptose 1-phosphate adenylyltransferase [Pseudomonadota bacterium]
MDLSALQPLLAALRGVRVACLGDLMLDRYVLGEVDRVSPEAPIPILRRTGERTAPGAAANVARNVAALGGRVGLAGTIGDDEAGRELLRQLSADPAIELSVGVSPHRATTLKTRFVAGRQQLLRVDDERIDFSDLGQDSPAPVLRGAGAVLVSDYGKGAVNATLIQAVQDAARREGAPVIVDPKGRDFARYGPATLLKPNAAELSAATGLAVGTDAEVEAALTSALETWPAEAVLVTRAAAGMSLARRGEGVRHFRARPREVFDVSGAGDTSLAALGLALAAGAPIEVAVELAVLASGVAVGKAGTAVVTPDELIEAELAAHLAPAEAKIATFERALGVVTEWRARGLRVGFTNGCFDILHRGHVAYLAQARSWCDRLVLGLNTDGSVSRLKGADRPVNDLESRALVLGGLSSVDLITPFDEDTPIRLIEGLRPDVLIKGADYREEEVVGAREVRAWGGEVRLAEIVDGHSTTAAIARLRDAS